MRSNAQGFSITWYSVRLSVKGGERFHIFDCDSERPTETTGEGVAAALGLPLVREKSKEEIPQ